MRDMSNADKVRSFMVAMGQDVDKELPPFHGVEEHPNDKLMYFRSELLREEINEFEESGDPENLLKELCDLLYVTYGYAITFGLDIDTAFNRVHESNMSKLGPDGKPIYREDGKVMKGPNYKPADLSDLV